MGSKPYAYTLIVVFECENAALAQQQRNNHVLHLGQLPGVNSVIPLDNKVEELSEGMAAEIEEIEQRLKGQ